MPLPLTVNNMLFTRKLRRRRYIHSSLTSSHLFKGSAVLVVILVVFLILTGMFFSQAVLSAYNKYFSKPSIMLALKSSAVTFLDRNGEVIYRTPGRYNTKIVPLENISKNLVNATIAAEDKDFYKHDGFSFVSTARALINDLSHKDLYKQGGSTITQQLARNFFLNQDKTFSRKLREIVLSFELERRYSKKEILELYLNSIYYGAGAYGAPEAARIYFGKDVKDLTLAESSLLAGLPASPTNFSPITGNKDKAFERQHYVLDMMVKNGVISTKEEKEAKNATLAINSTIPFTTNAPHFVMYLEEALKTLLPNTQLDNSGLVIQTTMDLKLQKAAEKLVRDRVKNLSNRNVTNSAFYGANPKTGEILTMVGSVDFNHPNWGTVNVLTSPRSPGSAIKPLVYATAIAAGKITLGTVLDDSPVKYPDGDATYIPNDADGKFRGKVLPREALSNSLNIPAVEVLAKTGLPTAVEGVKNFGLENIGAPTDYGWSFVLGGVEVRGIDLATAYGALANGGELIKPWGIKEVKDRFGKVIYQQPKIEKKQVIDPKVAYLITNILSDNKARQLLFGPHNPLELDRPAAAKTGTAQDFKNAWAVGYTPSVLALSWFGNNDGSPMQNIWGLESAALNWREFMKIALAGSPREDFAQPDGIQTASICKLDGSLAAPGQPAANELFVKGSQPTNFGTCTFLAKQQEDLKKAADEAAAAAAAAALATQNQPLPPNTGGPTNEGESPSPDPNPTPDPNPNPNQHN